MTVPGDGRTAPPAPREMAGLRVHATPLPGVHVVEGARHADARGWFTELWNEDRYREAGIETAFVQDNASWSVRGVLRGLHYQSPQEQAKIVCVLQGAVFDVVVDVRRDSPTFGAWYGHELSAANGLQLLVPEGFAHGFLVLAEAALVHYGSSRVYDQACDRAVRWDDPDIGIVWPARPRIISDRDAAAPLLRDVPADHLPQGYPAT